MPQIEELQSSYKPAAPGWSYVVDTGYDPSKVAINPTSRKRARNSTAGGNSAGDLTLRQQTAIQKHIALLDKDNHKDDQISIPKSQLDADRAKTRTVNARRVLTSGKNFAYYVEEEEALLAQKGPTVSSIAPNADSTTSKPSQRPSKTPLARRKLSQANVASSSENTPAPLTPQGAGPSAVSNVVHAHNPMLPPDTILEQRPPLTISETEIEALIAAPPLTYNAARSAPPPASTPRPRVFCEICGYWGRAKCMKCGARICGVECKTAHDETRCVNFYA